MSKKNSINTKKDSNTINIVIIIGIVFLIGSLILMFAKDNKNNNYIKEINYNEYLDILKKDEYSIVLLTSPTCTHCNNYKPFVNYAASEYSLNVYDIDINQVTEKEFLELHDKYTATKNQYKDDIPIIPTPATIIIKNGEEITSILGDIGYNGLTRLLKNYQIIK